MYRSSAKGKHHELKAELDRALARVEKWQGIAQASRAKVRELEKKRRKHPSQRSPRTPQRQRRTLIRRLRRENARQRHELERLRRRVQRRSENRITHRIGHLLMGAAVPLLFIKAWPLSACVGGVGVALHWWQS